MMNGGAIACPKFVLGSQNLPDHVACFLSCVGGGGGGGAESYHRNVAADNQKTQRRHLSVCVCIYMVCY